MRILHVTESMSAGVVTLLNSMSRRQVELGCTVSILFVRRPETPPYHQLESWFDPEISLIEIPSREGGLGRLLGLAAALNRQRTDDLDVVHLHSSVAGGVGRVVHLLKWRRVSVFYSPHGFAFLRVNQARWVRGATRLTERLLSHVGNGLILTARSEQVLARRELRAPRTFLLQTGVPSVSIVGRVRTNADSGAVHVAMIGRVSYQKAPWRFGFVATALRDQAKFTWVGSGDAISVERWLGGTGVVVVDWLSPDKLHAFLDSVDIILFPSLWEGMSLSLIQAQARGIPAVVSDAVGNVDTIVNGVTGFVCRDESEMADRVQALIQDETLREKMSDAAVRWARKGLSDDSIGIDTLAIYGTARSRRASSA